MEISLHNVKDYLGVDNGWVLSYQASKGRGWCRHQLVVDFPP